MCQAPFYIFYKSKHTQERREGGCWSILAALLRSASPAQRSRTLCSHWPLDTHLVSHIGAALCPGDWSPDFCLSLQ